jgi:hypothetical protein
VHIALIINGSVRNDVAAFMFGFRLTNVPEQVTDTVFVLVAIDVAHARDTLAMVHDMCRAAALTA